MPRYERPTATSRAMLDKFKKTVQDGDKKACN
jgi:hypothetical protein